MLKLTRSLFVLFMVAVLVAPLTAQENKTENKTEGKATQEQQSGQIKGKKKEKKKAANSKAQARLTKELSRRFQKANLSDEQMKQLGKLVSEKQEEILGLQNEITKLMPKGNRKKLNAAMKKLRSEGVDKKEIQARAFAEIGVSKENLAKVKEFQAKRRQLMADMAKAFQASLSDEQKEAMKKGRGQKKGKRGKRGKRKKKGNGDDDQS